ncbi:MAG: glycoside hydrolase family 3 N-terminal domain-containing protein [Longimicrobiales bacterium]
MTRRCVVLSALLAAGCASAPPAPVIPAPVDPMDPAVWVESTLSQLSLEQKVAQLIVTRVTGDFTNVESPEFVRADSLVRRLGIGGIIVGLGSPTETAVKVNALQSRASLPLLIGADLEWGSAMRLWRPVYLPYTIEGDGGTAFPYAMGVAATGTPAFADTIGRITALEARAVGIHWLFAPVADLNTQAANPIVNIRSFGSDPTHAGAFVAAFVRGAIRAGGLTAVKHFPGHGETDTDSHVSLPRLTIDRETLERRELAPFRDAIAAGTSAVMMGHIAVPALAGEPEMPATLSPGAIAYLRDRLGFEGIIVTDAMSMGALAKLPGMNPGELAVRAVEAGVDVLLTPPDPERAHAAVIEAVRSGRIPQARIDDAVRRILEAKAGLDLQRSRYVEPARVNALVGSAAHIRAAERIAELSITLARDPEGHVPLDPRTVSRLAVVAFSAPEDLTAGRAFAAALGEIYGDGVDFVRLDEQREQGAFDDAVQRASRAEAIIFAPFLMPISGQGHLRLPERAEQIAARLKATGRPLIVVGFGDPYAPARLESDALLLAWQPRSPIAERAAARALAGVAPISGRLPVSIEGAARGTGEDRAARSYSLRSAAPEEVGMDPAGLERIDRLVEFAIVNGAAPGAAIAIGRHGRLVKLRGYGRLDWRDGFRNVTDRTIYDLASLTKPVATTSAVMMLVDEGAIDLDAPIARYLPEWRNRPEHRSVTVRNLLLHDSGLPAWAPLHNEGRGRADYRTNIAGLRLNSTPGERTVYSDLGFILLAMIVEEVSGTSLDEYVETRLFEPLGMIDTGFNPLGWDVRSGAADDEVTMLGRIAPTERTGTTADGFIHGIVHDENARGLGGVAGHAGLFSTARDLAIFAQMLLNGGWYDDRRYVDPATVDRFTRRFGAQSTRGLGWDTPGETVSTGDYFTWSSFGHTGFTGTSIWIDPERDVFVVLLTNRVNPSRHNQRHNALRRQLADAVQRAIVDMPVTPRSRR